MKGISSAVAITAVGLLAMTVSAETLPRSTKCKRPLVQDKALVNSIHLKDLMKCAQDLEDIAYATPARNRVHGSDGHKGTVKYFKDTLEALGDYYKVELQEFTTEVTLASATAFSVDGVDFTTSSFEFGNNGTWTDLPLVNVANLGCAPEDVPDTVAGNVALIARGECTFVQKITNAGAKGAVAAMIYNNADAGAAAGTLGGVNDLIPLGGLTRADGLALAARVEAGETVTSSGNYWAYVTEATSHNVIATSKYGDPDNVLFLGAHSDSVDKGPGINDNGSGSCGILTVAKALSQWRTKSQVKFAWWTAEEEGLLGAEHFVNTSSAADLSKIRLYLNFDMIASPNYYLGIYDGDGSRYNLTGPPGSDVAEKLFEDWFAGEGLTTFGAEFNGRSDYGPFLDAGVPCSGLDTGADGVKTAAEVAIYGGVAGEQYDQNYHGPGDNVANLAALPFEANARAIAHAVASYGRSWKGFPARLPSNATATPARRHVHARSGSAAPRKHVCGAKEVLDY
ncbi:putative aminopeptidase y [Rosellinia necatrix]|uniref:Peptide hydrolase n=1 Tax=Rosellinia necatrix TaxID=77044 RepID=A0A1S7UNY7_ROSNE|nr:putative aminopeptidase y [Rosellinia necatrix]